MNQSPPEIQITFVKNPRLRIFLYGVCAILVVFQLYCLSGKTYNGDEAIIIEQAQRLAEDGHVSSPMSVGLEKGWEKSQLYYHKLYVVIGSVIYRVAGISLLPYRFVAFLFYLGIIFIAGRILRLKKVDPFGLVLFTIILLGNNLVYGHGLIFRPENAVAFFGLTSCYLLLRRDTELNTKRLVFAGVCAGLAALTHLNGLAIIGAGGILLLSRKDVKQSVVFGVTAFLVFGLFFIEVNTAEKWRMLIDQLTTDPNFEEEYHFLLGPFIKIFSEHQRLFQNLFISLWSVSVVLVVAFSFKAIWRKHRDLLIFTLALIGCLAAITHGPTPKYGLLYLPQSILLVCLGIYEMLQDKKKNRKSELKFVLVLLIIYFTVNIGQSIRVHFSNKDSKERLDYISSFLPKKGANVMAHEVFFFQGEYPVRSALTYSFRTTTCGIGEFSQADFMQYNLEYDNQYIVLDATFLGSKYIDMMDFHQLKLNDQIGQYRVIQAEEDLKILERIEL